MFQTNHIDNINEAKYSIVRLPMKVTPQNVLKTFKQTKLGVTISKTKIIYFSNVEVGNIYVRVCE